MNQIIVETLPVALVLAGVYALALGAREGRVWRLRPWISAAAGVSVAYVFVDILPELAERNEACWRCCPSWSCTASSTSC
jgi:hypothetical protein